MIRPLAPGYRVEIDSVDHSTWYGQIAAFHDANLYQAWQHGAGRERFTSVSRLLLRHGDSPVAAAEVRLYRVPMTRRGVAYLFWGPLCKPTPAAPPGAFRQMIRALRNEYVVSRGMVLRIRPRLVEAQNGQELATLADEGFSRLAHIAGSRSLLIDLSPEIDELRRGLDKKWRNCLTKAEKSNLTLESGTSSALFGTFTRIYERMLQRKQFAPSADIAKHHRIQEALPEALKMRVIIASDAGQPCAGAIYSAMGDTALYLFGATEEAGMRTCASYLVQWEILKTLKSAGLDFYDLNGIDPASNPGTYHFKQGLAGKTALDVTFPGQFQASNGSLASSSLLLIERVRQQMRHARLRFPTAKAAQ